MVAGEDLMAVTEVVSTGTAGITVAGVVDGESVKSAIDYEVTVVSHLNRKYSN